MSVFYRDFFRKGVTRRALNENAVHEIKEHLIITSLFFI